ncbi:MAG: fibronectin type III domain-containing protein [Nitrosomonadales bacterium]|nr:fibronectin type III domain-containing protein [Nitrosomonadales bacterium]
MLPITAQHSRTPFRQRQCLRRRVSNVALASVGAWLRRHQALAAIIRFRRSTTTSAPAPWGTGGGWRDATFNAYPDWVQINFGGTKTVDRVVVYTLQDNYTTPIEPTDTLTFSTWGVTGFTVQGWNGSAWITLATVSGNNLVKRTVNFTAFTTDRIRVNVTSALSSHSRITEIEAWDVAVSGAVPDTTLPTVPVGLSATPISTTQINLSWTASTDNVGVTGYKVYRGAPWFGSPTTTSYTDTGLTASTSYSYTLAACDAANNCSAQSNPVSATTMPAATSSNVALASVGAVAFSTWGVTGFTVQGWNGSAWITLATVSGNNLVKRTVNFAAFTTDRIRVNVTSALSSHSRITEIEAWGN